MEFLCAHRKIIAFAVYMFSSIFVAKAQLMIDSEHYQIDKNLHLIVCNKIPDKIASGTTSVNIGKTYIFSAPINAIKYGTAYEVSSSDTVYKLYFTQLPIINLSVKNAITDDETGGLIDISDTVGTTYHSNIGIKIRGNYSSTLPKKPYRVQLWTDSTGNTTKDESIFGMRSDKRWLMLAMYNEKLRLNNKVSHDLWLKLHKLYYADLEPDAHSTIRSRYTEAFLNGAYQGVYLFTEDQDRKQLKLKKQTTAGTGGELYKGDSWDSGTLFAGLPALPTESTELWGGWELDYPDETDWVNLHSFTDFAVDASDSTFKQQISSKIREDNFADYFIFLNLTRAEDNTGKNLFLARYNETSPYFIAPWDLDGTWGYYWSGDRKDVTNDILLNNLFQRLLNTDSNFKMQLATRWFSLRESLLSIDSLYADINVNYNFLTANGVYERENMVWSGDYLSYGKDELDYVQNWTQARVTWLDSYFKSLVSDKPIVYSFTGSVPEKAVVLTWSANCPSIHSFDVEASTDSLTWHTITPNSLLANDSTTCNYTLTDNYSETPILYYRLKVTDKNNGISYSAVLRMNVEVSTSAVSLYPNPVATTLLIRGDVEKVNIYSLLGACVYESDSVVSDTIDMQNLSTGIYLVRVTQKNGSITSHRIVVDR